MTDLGEEYRNAMMDRGGFYDIMGKDRRQMR